MARWKNIEFSSSAFFSRVREKYAPSAVIASFLCIAGVLHAPLWVLALSLGADEGGSATTLVGLCGWARRYAGSATE